MLHLSTKLSLLHLGATQICFEGCTLAGNGLFGSNYLFFSLPQLSGDGVSLLVMSLQGSSLALRGGAVLGSGVRGLGSGLLPGFLGGQLVARGQGEGFISLSKCIQHAGLSILGGTNSELLVLICSLLSGSGISGSSCDGVGATLLPLLQELDLSL